MTARVPHVRQCQVYMDCSYELLFDVTTVLCRYFTVPFMMVLLHMKPPTRFQAGVTAGLFALVNAAVLYVFLLRPFKWHDGGIARFMF